jgi:reactive intermediate/imine deaminase
MTNKAIISTENAPGAIGTYSQAVKVNNTVYLSGQIALKPDSMTMIEGDFAAEAQQVFKNLRAVCEASNGTLADIVKLNIFLTDLNNFAQVNAIMAEFFSPPYPARAAVGINQLPKGAQIEVDGILVL